MLAALGRSRAKGLCFARFIENDMRAPAVPHQRTTSTVSDDALPATMAEHRSAATDTQTKAFTRGDEYEKENAAYSHTQVLYFAGNDAILLTWAASTRRIGGHDIEEDERMKCHIYVRSARHSR